MVRAVLLPHRRRTLAWGCDSVEHAMSQNQNSTIAVVDIDM
jgi:hypothetical protein